MKRLIIVYNPRSSRFEHVRQGVLVPAQQLKGYLVGKYEVAPTDINDNIRKLAKIIKDGDTVISAGGDATGIIAANGIIKSGAEARLAVLPYGNFNDLAHTLGLKEFAEVFDDKVRTVDYYPLAVKVDGKLWRYATCYVTIGMTAEAVKLYDHPTMRSKLKTKFGRQVNSYTGLIAWYLRNRHQKQFIPEFRLNGEKQHRQTSDYAAVNGRYMARVMQGREDYLKAEEFRSVTDRLANMWRLTKLMTISIVNRVPGETTRGDILEFVRPGRVEIQSEGESQVFENVHKIEIGKGTACLKVIQN